MDQAKIKAVRVALGWTQREMADHLGVSIPTISGWERGLNGPCCRWMLKELERISHLKRKRGA